MFDVGGGELVLIVIVIIVLFGPQKIPEIARMVNKVLRHFYQAKNEMTSQFRDIQNGINEEIKPVANSFSTMPNATVPIIFSDEKNLPVAEIVENVEIASEPEQTSNTDIEEKDSNKAITGTKE